MTDTRATSAEKAVVSIRTESYQDAPLKPERLPQTLVTGDLCRYQSIPFDSIIFSRICLLKDRSLFELLQDQAQTPVQFSPCTHGQLEIDQ